MAIRKTVNNDNQSAGTSPTVDGRARVKQWLALVMLMLPVLLVAVDNTVLSFALPVISESLTPNAAAQLWIVDAYPLVLAGLLVAMGSFGDRWGRKRMLLIGATGFGLVSIGAAFVPNAEMLILARVGLGFFGAMLMPSTLSLLRSIFPNREQRRLAIAIWASGFSAGAALGPIVGGILLEQFGWGSVFLIAVPVLLPLLIFAPFLIPESKDPNPGKVDPVSIVLSMVTLVPLVFAIKQFATEGFQPVELVLVATGVVAGVVFVRRQLSRDNPMLDMRLFENSVFSGAVLINLVSVFSLVGFLFFASQHLQLVLDLSPIDAAFALVPGLIVMVISGLGVVRVVRYIRPGFVVATGLAFGGTGYFIVMITGQNASALTLAIAFAVLGLGIGAAETISNDLIIAAVPPAKAGAASGVSETSYELGAVLGTAVLGSILTASYSSHIRIPDGISAEQADAASQTLGGAVSVARSLGEPLGTELLESARHAFDSGVVLTSGIGFILMVLAVGLALFTLRRERP
ncbi:MFS transporter [Alpinimonas psychrophila]|uniref:DHA2 family multidrug resistance protein-like MFS transporter n=1 Tax=Alpinimonas psychrophila TaxID=748908 RepID=A0A7W3JTJ8_9MICO|nr:MFS transporter [Alpinimonas psychrophila]MBA8829001.1 DHA2 family multidrug resistance protein-like MFS transporter [Alpinimonas psychrophila]